MSKLLIFGALAGGLYFLLRKGSTNKIGWTGQPVIPGGYTERPSATLAGKGVDTTSLSFIPQKGYSFPVGSGGVPSTGRSGVMNALRYSNMLGYSRDITGPVQPGPPAMVALYDPRGYATGTASPARQPWFDNKSDFGLPVGDAYYQLRV